MNCSIPRLHPRIIFLLRLVSACVPLNAFSSDVSFIGCYENYQSIGNPHASMNMWRIRPFDFAKRLQMCLDFCATGAAPPDADNVYTKEGGFPHRYGGYSPSNWCFCGGELKGTPTSTDPNQCQQNISVYGRGGTVQPPLGPGTTTTPGPGGKQAAYLGCFRDQGDPHGLADRDINGFVTNLDGMTTETCISECRTRGFAYAGTQYGRWCFCGNSYGTSGVANNCNMACSGNSRQICGGAWANSVYAVGGATPTQQTFNNPGLGQNRLDWCREWGTNCGQPAADAWCRAAGFSRAAGFRGPDMTPNVTQIIGTNQLCQGQGCGGFYSITCQ